MSRELILEAMLKNRKAGMCNKANAAQIRHEFGTKTKPYHIDRALSRAAESLKKFELRKLATEQRAARNLANRELANARRAARRCADGLLGITRIRPKRSDKPKPQYIVTGTSITLARQFIQNCFRAGLQWRDTLSKIRELYPQMKPMRVLRLIAQGKKTVIPPQGRVCGLIRGVPFYEDDQRAEMWSEQ